MPGELVLSQVLNNLSICFDETSFWARISNDKPDTRIVKTNRNAPNGFMTGEILGFNLKGTKKGVNDSP